MILIFSFAGDLSTNMVIDWLNHHKYPFFRLNSSDFYNNSFHLDLLNRVISIDGNLIPLDKIRAVWFRKFGLKKDFALFQKKDVPNSILFSLNKEHEILLDTIFYLLKDKKWLTHSNLISLNKPVILLEAMEVGLNVSETHILNSTQDLEKLIGSGNYITKTLYEPSFPTVKNRKFSMYTKILESPLVNEAQLPPVFSASLVQKLIKKEYEIRVFCLNKQIYSAAIFSQNDTQTKVDFRVYNWFKPNRYVPYNLPSELKKKLIKLMHKIGLNCCSVDLIKSTDGKYYFLEINPVGQFGMIDFPCNFNLHRKVAEELIKMDTI